MLSYFRTTKDTKAPDFVFWYQDSRQKKLVANVIACRSFWKAKEILF